MISEKLSFEGGDLNELRIGKAFLSAPIENDEIQILTTLRLEKAPLVITADDYGVVVRREHGEPIQVVINGSLSAHDSVDSRYPVFTRPQPEVHFVRRLDERWELAADDSNVVSANGLLKLEMFADTIGYYALGAMTKLGVLNRPFRPLSVLRPLIPADDSPETEMAMQAAE